MGNGNQLFKHCGNRAGIGNRIFIPGGNRAGTGNAISITDREGRDRAGTGTSFPPNSDAKDQCESDGAFLAVPRSDAENNFIADLLPEQHIWIGINDIDQEGKFVAVDGRDFSYRKWKENQTDNAPNKTDIDENGVHIGYWENDWDGYWNVNRVTVSYRFVCSYTIRSKFILIIIHSIISMLTIPFKTYS